MSPRVRSHQAPECVPFDGAAAYDFDALTHRALQLAEDVEPPYADLLALLEDCEGAYSGPLVRQQKKGASYKQLAAIGHMIALSKAERIRWYQVARDVPLSCRHAGHILSRLKKSAQRCEEELGLCESWVLK